MKKEEKPRETATGKYVYDKATGRIVKVSERASAAKNDAGPSYPSCGTGGCCSCG